MIREIIFKDNIIQYNLQYKNVKNINMRIKPDGSINVSANRRVSQKVIDDFINSKADFILRALEKYKNRPIAEQIQYYTEEEVELESCNTMFDQIADIDKQIISLQKRVKEIGSDNVTISASPNEQSTSDDCVV